MGDRERSRSARLQSKRSAVAVLPKLDQQVHAITTHEGMTGERAWRQYSR